MANFKSNPNEILAIGRQDATLAIEAFISPPPDGSNELSAISPLKDSPFSRFVFTYIGKDGIRPKGNLPVDDFASLKLRAEESAQLLYQYEVNKTSNVGTSASSPAYTVKLAGKLYTGKTVAEILKNPDEMDNLLNTKKWLEANVRTYPANKEKIDAIEDGIKLFNEGKLKVETAVVTPTLDVYKGETKYIRQYDNEGRNLCYQLEITFNAAMNMPYAITIKNFFAPLDEKTKMITMKEKVNEVNRTIRLTEKEFLNLIEKMKEAKLIYDICYGPSQWKRLLNEQYHGSK